jgi:hypothetical protein
LKGQIVSITFWMPQAPVERVKPYEDEPDYYEVRVVPPFVEINMTGGNCNAILQLISPQDLNTEEDPHGMWDMADLARVRSATIRALNTEIKNRAKLDPWVSGGYDTGRFMIVECGRDAEYVTRRLENFLALTKVAMEHGFPVSFG